MLTDKAPICQGLGTITFFFFPTQTPHSSSPIAARGRTQGLCHNTCDYNTLRRPVRLWTRHGRCLQPRSTGPGSTGACQVRQGLVLLTVHDDLQTPTTPGRGNMYGPDHLHHLGIPRKQPGRAIHGTVRDGVIKTIAPIRNGPARRGRIGGRHKTAQKKGADPLLWHSDKTCYLRRRRRKRAPMARKAIVEGSGTAP